MSFMNMLKSAFIPGYGLYQSYKKAKPQAKRIGRAVIRGAEKYVAPKALAPMAYDPYEKGKVFTHPQQRREHIIGKTAKAYKYTPKGREKLEKSFIEFLKRGEGPSKTASGYYNKGTKKISLYPSGYDPTTLTHEFSHKEGMYGPGTIGKQYPLHKPLKEISPELEEWWNWRKTAWGKEYMNDVFRELGEREAVFGTEIPTEDLPSELKQYYAPLYQAGALPSKKRKVERKAMTTWHNILDRYAPRWYNYMNLY